MTTSCSVAFGQNNIAIKDDASISLTNGGLKSIGDFEALRLGKVPSKPYATFESNFWLLDGEYKIAPTTNARGGWISTDQSGSTGSFDFSAPKPEIKILFDDLHSTNGLTLYFGSHSGDYADNIQILFYGNAVGIMDTVYLPTGAVFSTNQSIANFDEIHIIIHSTNRASRYARLQAIDFDGLTRFTGTDIKAARVVQEINPLSTELTIDTLELTLFSSSGDFSIVAPSGFYAGLQYKEPLDVYEEVNGDTVYVGRFYLDEWESLSANVAEFKASDAIGLLSEDLYIGRLWSYGALPDALDVIGDIMTEAGMSYELDASLQSVMIAPWVNRVPYREALHMAAFAAGGFVTCARSNIIRILPFELAAGLTSYDHTLTAAQKGITSPLTFRPLVTGAEITSHWYGTEETTDYETIVQATLATGTHRIFFGVDVPLWDTFVVTGATNITSGQWRGTYIDISVSAAGDVVITGAKYRDGQKIHGVYNGSLPANTPPNIIKIADCTLVIPPNFVTGLTANADTIANRVYDYYQQRYLQKTRLFASIIAPGDSILVDVQSSKQMKGIVERMEIDLAGGFVSDVQIVGVIA